jgi:hypothetical protein
MQGSRPLLEKQKMICTDLFTSKINKQLAGSSVDLLKCGNPTGMRISNTGTITSDKRLPFTGLSPKKTAFYSKVNCPATRHGSAWGERR